MKWLLIGALALLASVVIALIALPDAGYVLIGYGKYSVETSLLVALVVLGLIYVAVRLLAGALHTPGRMQRWGRQRKDSRRRRLFDTAMTELAEGRIEKAEHRLARLARSGRLPLAASFSAARAASHQGNSSKRDLYLEQAQRLHPDAELAIELTRAELQLKQNEMEQAQTSLTRLKRLAPHNRRVLQLQLQFLLQRQDWDRLHELLPELRKRDAVDAARLSELSAQVYRARLGELADGEDRQSLGRQWKALPAASRQDPSMQLYYAEQLVDSGQHALAERFIVSSVKEHWNSDLACLVGRLTDIDSNDLLETVERWLEQHPQDPRLLLAAARLSLRSQLWGKARTYAENSIGISPTPQAYRLLGALFEQLSEPSQAIDCYRMGLALVDDDAVEQLLPARMTETVEELPEPVNRPA